MQGRLVRASQTLTENVPICIGDVAKDQVGLFLFENAKILSTNAKKERILCLTPLNHEIRVEIVSLTVNRETW